jgi:hypothetical protein
MNSSETFTIVAENAETRVGRVHADDPLSLILSPQVVADLSELCALARTRSLGLPPAAGADAIKALVERLHKLLADFHRVVEADALTVRQSETVKDAIRDIERIRDELGNR